ncbi:MAG: 5-oxoprolinase subunit PxpA [Bryobacteraceae bacterium]
MRSIDLNCDVGEMPEAIAGGAQEALMPWFSSVNIACGGHAGDERSMKTTIEQALRWNLAVGAHPGYPDPANFGRLEWNLPPDILADAVFEQILRLEEVAARCGARITHVKAHGALYNQAARQAEVARAVAAGVALWSRDVVLYGLAGSSGLEVFRAAGFAVAAEAFADRRYEPDGSLRSRRYEDALIRDPAEAARQAVRIAEQGTAQTICVHGDTPGAPEIAAAVARALREAGIEVKPVSRSET